MGADIYGPVHRKYSIRLNNFHLKNESYELKAAQNFAVLAHHLAWKWQEQWKHAVDPSWAAESLFFALGQWRERTRERSMRMRLDVVIQLVMTINMFKSIRHAFRHDLV